MRYEELKDDSFKRVKLSNVSNIVNITYGRDVGYKIEQEHFDQDIEDISATKIRQKLFTD